jgi:hypothetical protein
MAASYQLLAASSLRRERIRGGISKSEGQTAWAEPTQPTKTEYQKERALRDRALRIFRVGRREIEGKGNREWGRYGSKGGG